MKAIDLLLNYDYATALRMWNHTEVAVPCPLCDGDGCSCCEGTGNIAVDSAALSPRPEKEALK